MAGRKASLSHEETERILDGLRRRPAIWPLLEEACLDSGLLPDEVIRLRTRRATEVRRSVLRAVRNELGLSYPEIGRLFGLDHTTVMVGVRAAGGAAA